jgi:outer membrane protein TolC
MRAAAQAAAAVVLALAALMVGAARAETALTVEDAVRIARSRHPSVEVQRAAVGAAQARVQQAAAGFLPFLIGSLIYTPQSANLVETPPLRHLSVRGVQTLNDPLGRPVSVFCATPGDGACEPQPLPATSLALHSFWTAAIGIAWTPWDWGHSAYGYRGAGSLAQAAAVGVTTVERDVTLGARLAFYGVVAAEEQIKVGEESATTYRRQLDQVQAFYASGLRTGIDVATAQSGLANAELTLARARAGLETARAAFASALGQEAWGGWQLVYEPGTFEIQPGDEARASTPGPTLAETALRQRTELVQLDLQARGFDDQARAQRGLYLPALTLGLTPTWAGPDLASMTPNLLFSIGLGYSLGGMSPILVHGLVREARRNQDATLATLRATRNAVLQETADARALLAAAAEEVRAGHRLVDAATAQRNLAIGRYASGVGTIIELQDALLTYVSARFALVQAGYDLAASRAQLAHALGEE